MCHFPSSDPETRTLFNYLELMKSTFLASNIYEEEKQVEIILTHIPTSYFDSLVALSAPFPVSDLSLTELEIKLKYLYERLRVSMVSMMAFYDRKKLSSKSYGHFYKDLNNSWNLVRKSFF